MMSRDEQIARAIMKREGWPKVVNDADDLGGLTKGGITYVSAVAFFGPLTRTQFESLTDNDAVVFYTMVHIRPFDTITHARLREYVIDLGVLRGVRQAVRMLQAIVGTEVDGWLGPKTRAAITSFGPAKVLAWCIGARLWHIQTRIDANATQAKFRKGWRTRTLSFDV